jgi:hypothetical protein
LIITKVDEINEQFRNLPNGKHADLEELKQEAAKLLSISTSQVFCAVNYFQEIKKATQIDKLCYGIISKAVKTVLDHRSLDQIQIQGKVEVTEGVEQQQIDDSDKEWVKISVLAKDGKSVSAGEVAQTLAITLDLQVSDKAILEHTSATKYLVVDKTQKKLLLEVKQLMSKGNKVCWK